MNKVSVLACAAVAAGVVAAAHSASAQVVTGGVSAQVDINAPPPPPPPAVSGTVVVGGAPPPVVVAPQPVYAQPAQPVYAQPGYVQPAYAQPAYGQPGYVVQPAYVARPTEAPDTGRFRFGIDTGPGWAGIFSGIGSATGFAWGAGLRLGYQINNHWAVYYQTNLQLGVVGGTTSDGTGVGGVSLAWSNSIMGEFTVAHLLHLGIGPSLDAIAGAICASSSSTPDTSCVGDGGWFFGANGRIALTIGRPSAWGRRGFTVGLDLHPTFAPQATYMTAILGFGYEMY